MDTPQPAAATDLLSLLPFLEGLAQIHAWVGLSDPNGRAIWSSDKRLPNAVLAGLEAGPPLVTLLPVSETHPDGREIQNQLTPSTNLCFLKFNLMPFRLYSKTPPAQTSESNSKPFRLESTPGNAFSSRSPTRFQSTWREIKPLPSNVRTKILKAAYRSFLMTFDLPLSRSLASLACCEMTMRKSSETKVVVLSTESSKPPML